MLNKRRLVGFVLVPLMLMMALPVWAAGERDRLRGMDIVIGNWWSDYDVNTHQPQSAVEEQVLAQRRRLLQENNFRMRVSRIASWGEMLQTASVSIMAGNPAASIFVLTPSWAMTLHRQGLIAPIQSPNVDLGPARTATDVPWNQAMRNLFTFGGRSYGVSIGYGDALQPLVIFFNKRLFREAGLDPELPYNMQANRTWTWDNFINVARQLTRDIDGDGIVDTWAMPSGLATYILDAITSSNNAQYVGRNAQGRFYNATNSPQFLESIQFFHRLRDEGVVMPEPEGAHWTWFQGAFTDGLVAMRIDPLYVRNELQGMTDDWGMVMFPIGPRRNNFAVKAFENIMVIPATFNPEQVARTVEALAMWERPTGLPWQDGLWHLFRDRRAVTETMTIIRNPALYVVPYWTMIPGLQRGHIAWEMWWHDGDPAQLVEAVSLQWNALINDVNNDLF
jgi:hypothetical protein